MEFKDVISAARGRMGKYCKACPVCDGRACANAVPGPGAKGAGDVAVRNFEKWRCVRLNMDTLYENKDVDTSTVLFGQTFQYPFFAGPVGAVNLHYSDLYSDLTYNEELIKGCNMGGIAAFTGDGTDARVMQSACEAILRAQGRGVPTVKPWSLPVLEEKMALIRACNSFAVCMDIDAAGLPFLKGQTPPAGRKSVEEMRAIKQMTQGKPFIIKGIMTPSGAEKAMEAGADAIVVSNHGGRVLDGCAATAEVLKDIVSALRGTSVVVLVDGGIRSGTDIFRALALGARGVLIARPFVTAVYGAGAEGAKCYIDKLGGELRDAMEMCGACTIEEITKDMVQVL